MLELASTAAEAVSSGGSFGGTGSAFGAGGVGGVLLMAAYGFYRRLKQDNRTDTRAERADDWTDGLMERVKELEARLDVFAKDRNDAVLKAAKLEAEVASEKDRANKLEKEVTELRAIVDELRDTRAETRILLSKIQTAYSRLQTENQEFRRKLGLPDDLEWKNVIPNVTGE